jgi:hypothetical protein
MTQFSKHSAIATLEFSGSEYFGEGHMFVALFGHMAPMTGEAPVEHAGTESSTSTRYHNRRDIL